MRLQSDDDQVLRSKRRWIITCTQAIVARLLADMIDQRQAIAANCREMSAPRTVAERVRLKRNSAEDAWLPRRR